MKTYNDIKFKLFLCSNNSKIEINIRFRTLLYCSTLIEKNYIGSLQEIQIFSK